MLGRVLKEVARQLPWRKPASTDDRALLEAWATEFLAGDAPSRELLMQRLNRWIERHATSPAGWALRGDWQARLGRFEEAESDHRRALRLDPNFAQAQQGIGWALLKLGQLDEAYLHLETAHKLRPLQADTLVQWGLVSLERGDLDDAERKFQRAIDRDGSDAHAWHNMGIVAVQKGNMSRGAGLFKRALELDPKLGIAYSNLALALRDLDQLQEGIEAAQRSVDLKPGNARCLVILSDLLIDAGQFESAEQVLADASRIDPSDSGVRIALSKLFMMTGRYDDAEGTLRDAIEADSSDAEALSGLGQLELLRRRLSVGWELYEHRRRTVGFPDRRLGIPEWDGQDLTGKTLLLLGEQGLGDQIFFAGCIGDLLKAGAKVILETDRALHGLMRQSFPELEVIDREGTAQRFLRRFSDEPVDFMLPLGSLPRWFRPDVASFPASQGYLNADEEQVKALSLRLAKVSSAFKLGVAWRGGLNRTAGRQRSLSLIDMAPAFAPLGVTLVSLQHGPCEGEIASAAAQLGIEIIHWPELLTDQGSTAALSAAMDGIVTVCQTQAHLSGALGLAGCVLVPAFPNWRYGLQGTTVPWYPSLTLCRQSTMGEWSDPLQNAANWVAKRMEGRSS